MQGSALKQYIEREKRRILEDTHNEYDNYDEDVKDVIRNNDRIKWDVLDEIDSICQRRGRY